MTVVDSGFPRAFRALVVVLAGALLASDLAVPATASITVFNSDPGSGLSPAASLPIVAVPAATHPSATLLVTYSMSGRPHGVSVAPSGRLYFSLIDGNAVRRGTVDPNGESLSATPLSVGIQPAHVAIDAQGLHAYTANQGGQSVSVVDAEANTLTSTIPIAEAGFNVLASPAENRVYVSTGAGHLLVFDTQSLQQLASISVGGEANGLALDATNHRLYVSSISAGTITAIDLTNNTVARTYTVSGSPQRIAPVTRSNGALHRE
jgi:YVTN family beta-propeller protein